MSLVDHMELMGVLDVSGAPVCEYVSFSDTFRVRLARWLRGGRGIILITLG